MDYEEWKKSTANMDVDGKGYCQDFTLAYDIQDAQNFLKPYIDCWNTRQDSESLKELLPPIKFYINCFENYKFSISPPPAKQVKMRNDYLQELREMFKDGCRTMKEKFNVNVVETKPGTKTEVAAPKGKKSRKSKKETPAVLEEELFKEVESKVKQKNVVERELNRIILCLEPNQPGQPIKWTDTRTGLTCQMTERWDWANFMATDVITTKLQRKFEENRTTEDNLDDFKELNIETNDPSFNAAAKGCPWWVKITDEEFRKMTCKDYSSGQIHELLKRTFSVKFSIPYRPYVLEPKRGYVFTDQDMQDFVNHRSKHFWSLGQYAPVEEFFNNKKVKRRDHYILFNTPLSLRIITNILNKNINWVPMELYNENPSAQLFSRHYLIDNNFSNIDLLVSTIIKDLGIRTRIKSAVIARLKKNTLTPLHKLGLIKNVLAVKDNFGEVYKFALHR